MADRTNGSAAGQRRQDFPARSARRPNAPWLPRQSPAGTIVISTRDRRLYLMLGNGQACWRRRRPRRPLGGVTRISSKREWPSGRRRRRCASAGRICRHMAGAIDNPLGARAMYLSSTIYRIHGSNRRARSGRRCRKAPPHDQRGRGRYNRVRVGDGHRATLEECVDFARRFVSQDQRRHAKTSIRSQAQDDGGRRRQIAGRRIMDPRAYKRTQATAAAPLAK